MSLVSLDKCVCTVCVSVSVCPRLCGYIEPVTGREHLADRRFLPESGCGQDALEHGKIPRYHLPIMSGNHCNY